MTETEHEGRLTTKLSQSQGALCCRCVDRVVAWKRAEGDH